ncbi:hypothetical protein ALI144C_35960 [Actinosynnema sp. ALI-1.44]|nr:hypothetical protein ALI144C_35960 [Actinosynnema sp. ALI-1.44]
MSRLAIGVACLAILCPLTACESPVSGGPAADEPRTEQPTIPLNAACNLKGNPWAWTAPKTIGDIVETGRSETIAGVSVSYGLGSAVFTVSEREAVLSSAAPETDTDLTAREYQRAKDDIVKGAKSPEVRDGQDYNIPATENNRVAFKTIDSRDTQLAHTRVTRTAVRVCNGQALKLDYTDTDQTWSEQTWQRFVGALTLGVNKVEGGGETYVTHDVYGYYRVCNGVPVINAANLDMSKKPLKTAPLATYENLDPARAGNAHWTVTSLEFGAPYSAESSEYAQVSVVACFKAVAGTEKRVSTCEVAQHDGRSVSAPYHHVDYELTFYEAKTAKKLSTGEIRVPGTKASCHTDPYLNRTDPKLYSFPDRKAASEAVKAFAG